MQKPATETVWERIAARAKSWFGLDDSPPRITESTPLREVIRHYPQALNCLKQRFGLKAEDADLSLSLKELGRRNGLPPPQILYMEIQLAARNQRIRQLPPKEAHTLWETEPGLIVLDAREPSEWAHREGIAGALRCEEVILNEAVLNNPPQTPFLLYCHYGVRSMDLAHWMADQGYTSIFVIQGGLDAWSAQVDATIPRYDGNYC